MWTYKSINIYPASLNASGMRWYAYVNGQTLRADTKQGMRHLISENNPPIAGPLKNGSQPYGVDKTTPWVQES